MALLLAAVLALIPLAIAPGWFFYFDVTPKIVILLVGTAAALVWWSVSGKVLGWQRASHPARWFLLSLSGMALSLLVSALFSVNRANSVGGSGWRYWGLVTQLAALAFAYLVCAACAGQSGRLRMVLRGIAMSGLLVALYGIAQYFGLDAVLDPRGYHVGEGIFTIVRPPATLGHADYSANWLLFVVFASAGLAALEQKTIWRRLAWLAAALAGVAIVLSGTRAALPGLLIGGLFLLFRRGRRLRLPALALAIAVAALFYISPAGERLRARVHWALREPLGGARFLLWRDSLRMAIPRLAVGYGPETFIPAFALHQSVDLSRAYPDFYHESPHNMYIDALVSQGVAGPLLLLALAASGFMAAAVSRTPAALALAAGLAAMTISQQFACFTMPNALAYYVSIALLVSLVDDAALPKAAKPALRWPRALLASCCAGVLLFFALRLAVSETALAAARRDLDANQLGDAAEHYAAYQEWRWPGGSADIWYSRRLAKIAGSPVDRVIRVQAFQHAGLAAERATRTSEATFNAYYNLAAFYARQNDFVRTEQTLRTAISYAPNWFKTHWMLAQVLQAGGRLKEAEPEAAEAAALDGGKNPEVTATLQQIRSALRRPAM